MSPHPYIMANPNAGGAPPQNVTDSQNAFRVAQQANMVSQKFGIPMQGNDAGMWANILPAAIQIEEHKKMNQVALEYQQTYVNNFRDKYGFSDKELGDLKDEFTKITDHITGLIPDGELQTMYRKYVESYPHMYLSMIPREALQSKLAVKCVRENKTLRDEVASMSKCVTSLVQSLSKLQMAAGVPPIVNLMFESMPDPLTAITDPMYNSYNEAIKTYHALSSAGTVNFVKANIQESTDLGSALLSNPVEALKDFALAAEQNTLGVFLDTEGKKPVTTSHIADLQKVIANMGTSSGCQTYGDEWNHTGPEPAMNPAMCLAEGESMKPGNPRNAQGRTAVYKAQRTQDGGARWVLKGQVPNHTGQGTNVLDHAQMTQSARYHQQPANDWAHYAQAPMAPAAPKTRKTKKGKKRSSKK